MNKLIICKNCDGTGIQNIKEGLSCLECSGMGFIYDDNE